jgi:serpin B
MLMLLVGPALTLSAAGALPPEVGSVITANNQLAIGLYHQMSASGGNLFFSPYSIHKTLAMVYAGARNDTATEMAAVLHCTLGQERQHPAFREARQLLNQRSGGLFRGSHDVQLYLSANLWGQHGYGFQKAYLDLIQDCYGAGLQEVDFTAPEPARKTINAWVDEQTRHKIEELFPSGAITGSTRLVLASAIYFKGDWIHPFQKNQTHDEAFWRTATDQAPVAMMNQTGMFDYFENDHLQVLQMSYEGEKLALVVLLPKARDGLAHLEKTLTAETLATWTDQLRPQKVAVSLPRYKLTAASALEGPLTALGMKKAFKPGEADLSGMNGGREPLFIGAVVHKAFVDVNEEGTEAAAATGVAVPTMAMPTASAVPVFRADHPFLFAIRDVRAGMILFLGRMVQPSTTSAQ